MKNRNFQELIKSIDQARQIHKGKLKPGRTVKVNPKDAKKHI